MPKFAWGEEDRRKDAEGRKAVSMMITARLRTREIIRKQEAEEAEAERKRKKKEAEDHPPESKPRSGFGVLS